MDRRQDPYEPGGGMRPVALVGRSKILADFELALDRLQDARSAVAPIITGPRGSGKTVLLKELVTKAREREWFAASEEVSSSMPLPALVALLAHETLMQMSGKKRAADRVRRALGVLKAFSSVSVLGVKLNIEVEAVTGTADTGMFDRDLRRLFVELGETAREQGVGIVFALDEVHVLAQKELDSLNAALHATAQERLPVAFIGSGLFPSWQSGSEKPDPTRITSYAARMNAPAYVRLNPFSPQDSRAAFTEPVATENVEFTEAALEAAVNYCEGNAWLIQLLGKAVWEAAEASPIDERAVAAGEHVVQRQLDEWFFPRLLRDCERDEMELLTELALASSDWVRFSDIQGALSLGTEEAIHAIGRLAQRDIVSLDYVGNIRHGDFSMRFSVPRLRAHLGG
jgi:hypothetical protein